MANTFQELLDEIKTEALNVWENVKAKFIAEEAVIVPVIEKDVALVLSQLKPVAFNLITTLAGVAFNNLTGTQKNSITAGAIVGAAMAQGKTLALQDAQLLAQQAYNEFAKVAGAPPK